MDAFIGQIDLRKVRLMGGINPTDCQTDLLEREKQHVKDCETAEGRNCVAVCLLTKKRECEAERVESRFDTTPCFAPPRRHAVHPCTFPPRTDGWIERMSKSWRVRTPGLAL